MTAIECLRCEYYEKRMDDEKFEWCNHYEDCINKDYNGMCHCEVYWKSVEKNITNLIDKYGLEWVGDNSWRLDYVPLNEDIEFKTLDDFDYDTYEYQRYLDEEFEIVKPRIDNFIKELNEEMGGEFFSYDVDYECENRIDLKIRYVDNFKKYEEYIINKEVESC